jgi:tRNA G37 N-methylase TrmD
VNQWRIFVKNHKLHHTLKMKFKIFTLHPDIFCSFIANSLIARAVSKQIIEIQTIDWRQNFGIGNYKQVDDKPFGGGSGMVLMADPIINSMIHENCFDNKKLKVKNEELSKNSNSIQNFGSNKIPLIEGWQAKPDEVLPLISNPTLTINDDTKTAPLDHTKSYISFLPNNSKFYEQIKSHQLQTKKVNILMTPRGFPMTQQIVQWLAQDFEEINILCGRYEGFDARINDHIDLELSIGNFVLNGGEVGCMCLIEAISRLVPDFITKNTSVLHDSFSSGLNNYNEFEFANSKPQYQRELEKSKNNLNTITRHFERSERSHAIIRNDSNLKLPIAMGLARSDWGYKSDNHQSHYPTYSSGEWQINLFNNLYWLQNILPHIEHPQYTRPNIWQDPITNEQKKVPEVLLEGNHAKIQKWRVKWW